MKELLLEDGKRCMPTSEEAKTVVKEQGNVEALELLELAGTVQCVAIAITYVTSGHVCSQCGRVLKGEKFRPTHQGADPALPQAEV